MSGLELVRPWALLFAIPALALLFLASRRGRPVDLATGTLAVWFALAGGRPQADARRRPLPPAWLVLFVGAILALCVGAAGPRLTGDAPSLALRAIIAPGEDLALPFVDSDGRVTGRTRLDRALEGAAGWFEREAPSRPVEWYLGERFLGLGDGRPPVPIAAADLRDEAVGPLAPVDRRGTLLILARPPEPPLAAASWVASGGGAVPGPIAPTFGPDGRLAGRRFDGERVVQAKHEGDAVLLPEGLSQLLETLVRAWAASRGLEVCARPSGAPIWLELGTFADGLAEGASATGATWSVPLGAEAPPIGAEPPEEVELALRVGERAAFLWRPGAAWFAARQWPSVEGSETAFALAVGRLLDSASRAPSGRASVAARADAGPPASHTGRLVDDPSPRSTPLAWAAALVAVVATSGALWLRFKPLFEQTTPSSPARTD